MDLSKIIQTGKFRQSKIDGVILITSTRYHDERGYFEELLRETYSGFVKFGQWSKSRMYSDVTKAWHIHEYQTDYWTMAYGVIKAVLYDKRQDSPTYGETQEIILTEDSGVLVIPPGVAHGCKVLQGPALLMYITSEVYDPDDEGRIDHNDTEIGYDWLKRAEIK